jgi:CDP-diacylglycerol--glycerol-3-phosphate 3-phosphatidyltransferase
MTQQNSISLTNQSALQSYNYRHMSFLKLLVLSLALLLVSSTASSFSTRSALLPPASSFRLTTELRGGSEVPPQETNDVEEGTAPIVESDPIVESTSAAISAVANNHMGSNAALPGVVRRAFPHVAWHRIPNLLTYLRCLAIPVMVVMFYMPNYELRTSILFAFASLTDWLDGYLARRWDITSSFGAFLDPVADKLMVSTSLILLTGRYGKILAVPSLIILAREIAVSALREWMAQRGLRNAVKVGFQGKLKTAASMIALTLLLSVCPTSTVASPLYMPSVIMLYFCALVTVTSGSVYFRAAAPVLLESQ